MKPALKIFLAGVLIFLNSLPKGEGWGETFAQQLPLSSQYIVNKLWLTPTYAGTIDGFETFGAFRNEWMGIAGAPETKIISAHGSIYKNMGLGGSVSTMQAGIFTNISAHAVYAYHLRLAGAHHLSFGLRLGFTESHLNLSDAVAISDPVAANAQHITALVFAPGAGFLYRFQNLYAGFSAPGMGITKVKNSEKEKVYAFAPHYRTFIGYPYSFNADWAIEPVGVISVAENVPLFYEVTAAVKYRQKIWLAPAYKKTCMAIGLGAIPYGNFILHYTYELSAKGIMGYSSGTHEITMGWKLSSGKKKNDMPKSDPKKPYYDWINK